MAQKVKQYTKKHLAKYRADKAAERALDEGQPLDYRPSRRSQRETDAMEKALRGIDRKAAEQRWSN